MSRSNDLALMEKALRRSIAWSFSFQTYCRENEPKSKSRVWKKTMRKRVSSNEITTRKTASKHLVRFTMSAGAAKSST